MTSKDATSNCTFVKYGNGNVSSGGEQYFLKTLNATASCEIASLSSSDVFVKEFLNPNCAICFCKSLCKSTKIESMEKSPPFD